MEEGEKEKRGGSQVGGRLAGRIYSRCQVLSTLFSPSTTRSASTTRLSTAQLLPTTVYFYYNDATPFFPVISHCKSSLFR